MCAWNYKQPFFHGKDLVHHPIETTMKESGWPSGSWCRRFAITWSRFPWLELLEG